MAVYNNGIETKRHLVTLAYSQLKEKDVSEIRIRDIAAKSGCSPAAIYRHFESLEYLIVVASIGFLDNYLREYAELLDQGRSLEKVYLESWGLFNKYAFARPDVYYGLFWGPYNKEFEQAAREYCELFPVAGPDGPFAAQFDVQRISGDMEKRDLIMLNTMADLNLIRPGAVQFLGKTNSLIVSGMLMKCLNSESPDCDALRDECNQLLATAINFALAA